MHLVGFIIRNCPYSSLQVYITMLWMAGVGLINKSTANVVRSSVNKIKTIRHISV